MGDQGHILRLLHGAGGQHGKAGLAAGHNVRLVAEDAQRVGSQGAGRYVEHAGQQLAGDLIHIGYHQQEALRGGESACQRTRGQRAVYGARGARFRLHFCDMDSLPEQILPAVGGPFIHIFRHR